MNLEVKNLSKEELASKYLALTSQCRELQASNQELQASNRELLTKVENQQITINWFIRQYFGAKSERIIPQDPRQTTLFDISETIPKKATTVKEYERTVRKQGTEPEEDSNLRFDDSVPVEEKVVFPKEVEGLRENEYEIIGEKVTNRLKQTPCRYYVERTIRKTVKVKSSGDIFRAAVPDGVIGRSYADVSLLTGLIVDKFQYHLPLYRQHQRMKLSGINVSRANLTKLVHRSLELLEPIYYAILSDIGTSETVAMDETPIKAGRKIKGKMQTAYFWPVLAKDQVCFVYSSSRSHEVISSILGKVCKKLISDGYSAYTKYAKSRDNLVHASCWAHVRRKFFNAKDFAPAESEHVLDIIRKLFLIEKTLKDKEETDILVKRRLESLPLVEDFFSYIDKLWYEGIVIKNSPLGKAIRYARERKKELRQFLNHHDIPLSNNEIEREIRPVAVGRKNWLFCWSEVGAKYAAIAFTLIQCCKMHNINPWDYLIDVLQRIDSHPMRDVHLLTPKHWKQNFCKNAPE